MPSDTTVATQTDAGAMLRRVESRRTRYEARDLLWEFSSVERVRLCGRAATGDSVAVKVTPHGDGMRAGFGGVQSCGSVWSCPVCSEKINAGRQAELDAGIRAWLAAGHAVMFGTATLRHRVSDDLDSLLAVVSKAWNKTMSGAGAVWSGSKPKKDGTRTEIGDRARFGVTGYVRVVEIKHGSNGWHPHVHFLLFLDKALTPGQALDLQNRLFGRWEAALGKLGHVTLPGIGMDLRPVKAEDNGMADYFFKHNYSTSAGAAAYEVTGSVTKREGKGGRTPFDLLADFVATGDLAALDLWREYEQATAGQRQLTWSRGMRDLLALGAEVSDEQLVEDAEQDGAVVALITSGDYWRLASEHRLAEVLEAAEVVEDVPGRTLRRLLRRLGCRPLHALDE